MFHFFISIKLLKISILFKFEFIFGLFGDLKRESLILLSAFLILDQYPSEEKNVFLELPWYPLVLAWSWKFSETCATNIVAWRFIASFADCLQMPTARPGSTVSGTRRSNRGRPATSCSRRVSSSVAPPSTSTAMRPRKNTSWKPSTTFWYFSTW